MAHAQKLTQQVKDMSIRIKQLETALAHAQNGSSPISALGDDAVSQQLLKNSEQTDLEYEGDIDGVSKSLGSLAIDCEGKAQYYGETAGAEVLALSRPALSFTNALYSNSQFLQNLMPVTFCDFPILSVGP